MSLRLYTVHVRGGRLDRATLVREGFSWVAFLFTLPWLLAHRMWLILIAYLAAVLAVQAALYLTGTAETFGWVAGLGLGLLFAFEADALRRWSLARRGYVLADIVAGRSHAEAERASLAKLAEAAPVRAAETVYAPVPQRPGPPARDFGGIGLFPEREPGR